MSNKTQDLYQMAFSALKQIAEALVFKLDPKIIMLDFEAALRNSLKKFFPSAKQSGCYFHFVKCLHDKATKLGLRGKNTKPKMKLLICYLQLLVHCDEEDREKLYLEIKGIYEPEDLRFTAFFRYFQKEWLKNPFLDQLFQAFEENEELEFIRSNNPCEIFHSFMSKSF